MYGSGITRIAAPAKSAGSANRYAHGIGATGDGGSEWLRGRTQKLSVKRLLVNSHYTQKQITTIRRMIDRAGYASVAEAMTAAFGERKSRFGGDWPWTLSDLDKYRASNLIRFLANKKRGA